MFQSNIFFVLLALACVGTLYCQESEELLSVLSLKEKLKAPMLGLDSPERLNLACYLGMLDVVQIVYDQLLAGYIAFDINHKSNNSVPIFRRFKQGHPVRYSDYSTPLHEAAAGGHLPVVTFLIENGADIHAVTRLNCYTVLHLAAAGGWLPVVRFLVERGAAVDSLDRDRVTPLGVAVAQGELSMVRLLLELGANVDIQDREGKTPIYYALQCEAFDKVRCLIRFAADLSIVSADGQSPLQVALRRAEEIEERHRRSFCTWFCRWLTYLCTVKCDNHFDLVRYLVRSGCLISGSDRDRMRRLLPRFDIDAARRVVAEALDEVHESTGLSADLCGAVVDFLVSREHAE